MITTLIIDSTTDLGPIRRMNGVNNGPTKPRANQSRSNFEAFKALKVPYVRTHDANLCSAYGAPHVGDITAIFPNFDADVNDPASYDFTLTDIYLKNILDAGSQVFFRLGQSIEHAPKKYGVKPPKDFKKWAEICEHIIRHYNEGWADGFQMGIEYWEIWNEPDEGRTFEANVVPNSDCWMGTEPQFNDLYEITAKHLKFCFPHLKIGGPAVAYNIGWTRRFLTEMKRREVPIDFFSWHWYSTKSKITLERAGKFQAILDSTGYASAESILGEWNYVRNFGDEFIYTLEVESGKFNLKSAAYVADHMIRFQNTTRVDMMLYYDFRQGTAMNGAFDSISNEPTKAYYTFYAWSKLRDLGTQTAAEVHWEQPANNPGAECDIAATAARSADGTKNAVFLVRYNEDANVVATTEVAIQLKDGTPLKDVRCHLTDDYHTYTEVPLVVGEDGVPKLKLYPNAFALIEWTQA